ncbi:MAG TPA: hypothetical protein VHN99_05025, partial [Deinococcales bacterium]|nr:hypothetical protein [Deinococcales bacterium]
SLQVNLHGPAELAGQIPETVVLDGNGQPVASPAFQPGFAYDPGSQEFNAATVPNLAAGPYTVSFANLTVNGVTYAPDAASLPASVTPGNGTPVDVTYTATTGTVTIDFFGPDTLAGALPQGVFLGTPDSGGTAVFTGPRAYDLGTGVFYEYTITGASLGNYTVNPSGFGFNGNYYQPLEGMVQQSLSGGQSLNFQVHYEPTGP